MKEVLKIGIPAMLDSLVAVIIAAIDTRMISVLGAGAVSAVSFTTQPKLIIFSVFFALGATTSIFVAQAYGKEDPEEANKCFHMILRATVILSVFLGVLTGVLARPIMHLCNRQADTVEMSVTFFRIIMTGMIFQNLSVILNSALRGIGKTGISLYSGIAMGVVDILLNYLLIEGHLGSPRKDVAGDAVATVCGTLAACIFSAVFLARTSGFLHLNGVLSDRKKDAELAGKVREKAAGIVSENILTRVGFLLSSIILSTLDSRLTAVYYVAMILLNYSFAFGDGLQTAALTLVGRSIGAEDYDGVRNYSRQCRVLGLGLSAALSCIYILRAESFFGRYFSDRDAVELGMRFAYVAAALTFLQILRLVNVGTMRGIGDVKAPLVIATVCVMLINPGMSYLLTVILSYGIWGIWQASLISQGVWFLTSFYMVNRDLRKLPA